MRDLRQIGGERVDIFQGETDLHSRLLPARLHGSFARNNDHQLGPEVSEDVGAGLPKSIAIGQQHDNRGNPPRHAEHSQRRAPAVVAHRVIGLLKQIANHRIIPANLFLAQCFHGLQHGGLARWI